MLHHKLKTAKEVQDKDITAMETQNNYISSTV